MTFEGREGGERDNYVSRGRGRTCSGYTQNQCGMGQAEDT